MNTRQPTAHSQARTPSTRRPAPAVPQAAAPEFARFQTLARTVTFDRAALTLAAAVDEVWLLEGSDPALQLLVAQEQTVLHGPNCDVISAGFPVTLHEPAAWSSRWPLLTHTGVVALAPYECLLVVPVGYSPDLPAIGTLCLARDSLPGFTTTEIRAAIGMAGVIADSLLARWAACRDVDRFEGLIQDQRHVAAGMLASFLGMSSAQALSVMRARAFSEGRTLAQFASEIISVLGAPDSH